MACSGWHITDRRPTHQAMLIFNAAVPCFPLDCSQIVVSVLGMRGWQPIRVAKAIILSSCCILLVLLVYGFVRLSSGDPSAVLCLLIAAWLGESR